MIVVEQLVPEVLGELRQEAVEDPVEVYLYLLVCQIVMSEQVVTETVCDGLSEGCYQGASNKGWQLYFYFVGGLGKAVRESRQRRLVDGLSYPCSPDRIVRAAK